MELRYVWIQDYKNIKNTGFNISNQTNEVFEFIDNNLIINVKFKSTPKDFYKKNITSVTAIVGKNGSGKTNFTEFINYGLAHVRNGGLSTYLSLKGFLVLDKLIFIQDEILIKNIDELSNLGYKVLRFKNVPLDESVGHQIRWHEMEKNKYIYYNPTFDFRAVNVRDNLVNISTTNLVYYDLYNSRKLFPYAVDEKSKINPLMAHQAMEDFRLSNLLLNFRNLEEYIDFLPEDIIIMIDNEQDNYLLRNQYFDEKAENYKELNKLQRELNWLKSYVHNDFNFAPYLIEDREDHSYKLFKIPVNIQKIFFRQLFYLNTFQVLLNNETLFPIELARYFIISKERQSISELKVSKKIFDNLLRIDNYISELMEKSKWDITYLKQYKDTSYNFENNHNEISITFGKIRVALDKNRKLINSCIGNIKKLLNGKDILSYNPLKEFSSGQRQLLSLFARFYWAKDEITLSEIKEYGILGESIIIFIDEGEVALHPEWQREFFNKISSFLSELFSDKNIQIILTTHSPFVLSDIPKNDILFLNNSTGNLNISNLEKENTFGANIYSLLSDSFFMDNTMGKFSENKIKEIIKILTSDHSHYNDKMLNETQFIIDSIGEPIIKEQLEYLFNDKFGNNNELSILRKRIVELEKQLNRDSNDTH